MKRKIFLILLVLAVAIQVVPYGRNHTNPAVVAQPKWDALRTKALFDRACADCHSNQTHWPWYSHMAPVSWLVQRDVDGGRRHLNVDALGKSKRDHTKDAANETREGEMPPWFYLPAHPDARLSAAETAELVAGLKATFGEKAGEKEGGEKEGEDDDD